MQTVLLVIAAQACEALKLYQKKSATGKPGLIPDTLWLEDDLTWDGDKENAYVKLGNYMWYHVGRQVSFAACGHCSLEATSCQKCQAGPDLIENPPSDTWKYLFGGPVNVHVDEEEMDTGGEMSCPEGCKGTVAVDHFKKLIDKYYLPKMVPSAKTELQEMASQLKDHLVIYLRGGDILKRSEDFMYFPAPCAYFDHVINYGNGGGAFDKIQLVAEPGHPCVQILIERNPTKEINYHSQSLQKDWTTMMAATNLALSIGSTFGISALAMNIHPDVTVFFPRYSDQKNGKESTSVHLNDGGHPLDIVHAMDWLCPIGKNSILYDIPEEPTFAYKNRRTAYIVQDKFFNGTKTYKC